MEFFGCQSVWGRSYCKISLKSIQGLNEVVALFWDKGSLVEQLILWSLCRVCPCRSDMIWYMVWYMTWHDTIWYVTIWYDMIWYDMIWYMTWHVMIWYDTLRYDIWYDMIYDMTWYYMIRYDMIGYDIIWYDIYYMTWYDMVWYDMIWYDMICTTQCMKLIIYKFQNLRYSVPRLKCC